MNISRAGNVVLRAAKSRVPSVTVAASYHEKVIDHYENPRNVGALDKNDPSVGTGIVGAPACGDVMKLQIKVRYICFVNNKPTLIHFSLGR